MDPLTILQSSLEEYQLPRNNGKKKGNKRVVLNKFFTEQRNASSKPEDKHQ